LTSSCVTARPRICSRACRDDRAALREFYQQLSPQTRYFRFFGKPPVDGIVEDVVRAVESGAAVALLAEIDHRIVAVGQYFRGDTPGRAEAAFAISDAHRRHAR